MPYFILFLVLLMSNSLVFADSAFIDKIYHPYVQPHEKEFEWRLILQDGHQNSDRQNVVRNRFAYGQSFNDRWFSEVYLIAEKNNDQQLKITAIELETLWQITEQGEYGADFGLLVELEHEIDNDISEISTAFLIEKEWGKWSATSNLYLIYEWGKRIQNEFETAASLQVKYRYSKAVEPAIELYASEFSKGMGPVLLGGLRLGGRKKLKWEAGLIFGLNKVTPDRTARFLIEFEF